MVLKEIPPKTRLHELNATWVAKQIHSAAQNNPQSKVALLVLLNISWFE
jgi:hypothetical protein